MSIDLSYSGTLSVGTLLLESIGPDDVGNMQQPAVSSSNANHPRHNDRGGQLLSLRLLVVAMVIRDRCHIQGTDERNILAHSI